jgi:nucleoside-diphosphate kinase
MKKLTLTGSPYLWTLLGGLVIGVLAFWWQKSPLELTFIIIKPDGVQADIRDEVYSSLRSSLGLQLIRERTHTQAPRSLLELHYHEHQSKSFFNDVIDFMQSGPIIVSMWAGPIGTINAVRELIGSTDPTKAAVGTIRQRFGTSVQRNAVHSSDSKESADREIRVWFG